MSLFDTKLNETTKFERIHYSKIRKNTKNPYTLGNIEDLADNIQKFGILDPLRVKIDIDHNYIIISGHRRYCANLLVIDQLRERNEPTENFELLPCIIEGTKSDCNFFDNEEKDVINNKLGVQGADWISNFEESMKMIVSNITRDKEENNDHIAEIAMLSKSYDEMRDKFKELNINFTLGRKRDWIGQILNLSGRQIQNYMSIIALYEENNDDLISINETASAREVVNKIDEEEKKKNYPIKLKKTCASLTSKFADLDLSEYKSINDQDSIDELKKYALELSNVINHIFE